MALSTKLPWDLANTKWAAELNPMLSLPILNGNLITDIHLTSGVPQSVNHLLGRVPQGWFLADNNASAIVYRSQNFTEFSITLKSNADTTVSIWIF